VNAKRVAAPVVVLGLLAAAAYAVLEWRRAAGEARSSQEKILEAREILAEAAADPSSPRARDLRASAVRLAKEAVELSPESSFEAWRIQGEAHLGNTRYLEAAQAFERALTIRRDPRTAECAAEAYHRRYETGRKPSDFQQAMAHYDEAIEAETTARTLLSAAKLAKLAGEGPMVLSYLERLERLFPSSEEAAAGRELR
jgi:tetratricopeptide (TPR) repeat protein